MASTAPYSKCVFINCPFDKDYTPIFRAIVFAVFDVGFVARTSLEFDDGTRVRITNLLDLIQSCQYGIHDISRIQLDPATRLPRFNMPLELGMFLAAKACGSGRQRQKVCLILDSTRYRYQEFISDIAGQDPHAHGNDPKTAINEVRTWLATNSPGGRVLPGGAAIWKRYQSFIGASPGIRSKFKLRKNEVTFVDYTHIVSTWLKSNPW